MFVFGRSSFLVNVSVCALLFAFFWFLRSTFAIDEEDRREPPLRRTPYAAVTNDDLFFSSSSSDRFAACRPGSDDDCPPESSVCHLGACVPKLVNRGECDPKAGTWTPVERDGGTRMACVCLRPDLVTQRFVGSDCDREVACGLGSLEFEKGDRNGRKNLFEKSFADGGVVVGCRCPTGRASWVDPSNGRPSCRLEKAFDRLARKSEVLGPCPDDEVDVRFPNPYFDEGLYAEIRPVRCVKRPCSYDALTGRPLKKALFAARWGCVCDPRWGNVGVRLRDDPTVEGRFLADDVPGYDACVNIFGEGEPVRKASNVTLYTYFYVYDAVPVSFVQWSDLDPSSLAEPFRRIPPRQQQQQQQQKPFTLQVEETWPFDHAQFVLRDPDRFLVRVPADTCRQLNRSTTSLFRVRYFFCGEYVDAHYIMPDCRNLPYDRKKYPIALLLQYPLCYMHGRDAGTSNVYDDRVVTNPLYVTERNEILARLPKRHDPGRLSNGFEMTPYADDEDDDRLWKVRPAPLDPSFVEENPFEHVTPRFVFERS